MIDRIKLSPPLTCTILLVHFLSVDCRHQWPLKYVWVGYSMSPGFLVQCRCSETSRNPFFFSSIQMKPRLLFFKSSFSLSQGEPGIKGMPGAPGLGGDPVRCHLTFGFLTFSSRIDVFQAIEFLCFVDCFWSTSQHLDWIEVFPWFEVSHVQVNAGLSDLRELKILSFDFIRLAQRSKPYTIVRGWTVTYYDMGRYVWQCDGKVEKEVYTEWSWVSMLVNMMWARTDCGVEVLLRFLLEFWLLSYHL